MWKICEYCGKEYFVDNKYFVDTRKFCSKSCSTANRNKNRVWSMESKSKISKANKRRLVGDKNPNWNGGGNKLICRNCNKDFILANHELKKQKGYFCSRECLFEYKNKNRMSEVQNKLNRNMRRSFNRYVREKKNYRKWTKLIGYSLEDLMIHLESKFEKDMSWDNYGEWHIDHIKPVSAFNFESYRDDEFKQCWSLDNLQPLWALDNMRKGGVERWLRIISE